MLNAGMVNAGSSYFSPTAFCEIFSRFWPEGGGGYRTRESSGHEFAKFHAHSYDLLKSPSKNLIMFHEIRHAPVTFRALKQNYEGLHTPSKSHHVS